MSLFRKCFLVFFTAFWVLATHHCQLETITGLEFLQCAADNQIGTGNCDESDCCAMEKAQYKSEQNHLALPLPAAQTLLPVFALSEAVTLADNSNLEILVDPPPLCRSWQFVFRMASSPRAPSLAS